MGVASVAGVWGAALLLSARWGVLLLVLLDVDFCLLVAIVEPFALCPLVIIAHQ